jgi:hypothetical protein
MARALPHLAGFPLPLALMLGARLGDAWTFLPLALLLGLLPVADWLIGLNVRNAGEDASEYQFLDHIDEAPQLPAGYRAMFLAAMVPPVWRRLMDPRVEG